MTALQDLLDTAVADGTVPGAVALLARGDGVEVAVSGVADLATKAAMARDTIFRLASVTKPITAAALLTLVDDGRVALDDPIARWLPELERLTVVRRPDGPIDDVVPAARPITVADVLTSRSGWGWPSDFSYPQVQRLFNVQTDGREVQSRPDSATWLRELAEIPLLYQPGEAWLYDTSSDLQGILVERASGQAFADHLDERILRPLGMADTAFVVPEEKRDRFGSSYRREDGGFTLVDAPDGQWSTMPRFAEGSGGLVGTVDDWHRFARVLLDGAGVLRPESVRYMMTDHLTAAQREIGALFLEGQGWGAGGAVDIAATDPWTVSGRYGWVGGTGTTAYVTPSTGTVAILFTQVGVEDPAVPRMMSDFWTLAAR